MTDTPFRFRDIAVAAFGSSLFFSTGEAAVLPMIALSARADGDFGAAARAMSSIGGPRRIGTFVGPLLVAGAVHAAGLTGANDVIATGSNALVPSAARDPAKRGAGSRGQRAAAARLRQAAGFMS